jgi:hypothetical protein
MITGSGIREQELGDEMWSEPVEDIHEALLAVNIRTSAIESRVNPGPAEGSDITPNPSN